MLSMLLYILGKNSESMSLLADVCCPLARDAVYSVRSVPTYVSG